MICEGVINFVSTEIGYPIFSSYIKGWNIQYLLGFLGSGIRWKSKDTKLYTLPDFFSNLLDFITQYSDILSGFNAHEHI